MEIVIGQEAGISNHVAILALCVVVVWTHLFGQFVQFRGLEWSMGIAIGARVLCIVELDHVGVWDIHSGLISIHRWIRVKHLYASCGAMIVLYGSKSATTFLKFAAWCSVWVPRILLMVRVVPTPFRRHAANCKNVVALFEPYSTFLF